MRDPLLVQSYIDSSAISIGNILAPGAKIYKNVYAKNCDLGSGAILGDFTRTENSVFKESVRIQRNGMIYNSEFGRYSYTGRNCTVWHAKIGSFCSVSWNVSIGGANHDYKRLTTHALLYAPEFGFVNTNEIAYERFSSDCIIGHDVWIGAGAVVCRDVVVGNGAVVGAGSVVTKDVPPYAIVVGSPARVLKMRFDEETIGVLNDLEWWNLPIDLLKCNVGLLGEAVDGETLKRLLELKRSI